MFDKIQMILIMKTSILNNRISRLNEAQTESLNSTSTTESTNTNDIKSHF